MPDDPKCHSTACRFENFIFGTPLTDEARNRKVDLQKELILRIWSDATRAAVEAGADSIALEHVQRLIDQVVPQRAGAVIVLPPHLGGLLLVYFCCSGPRRP